MIRLITATPGSGKTCLVVEWLCKEIEKGFYKEFYSNIENLRITGIKPLPPNADWRELNPNLDKNEPPKLMIIDEAQYFDAFMKENRSASNRIGKDLSTHRHYGIDIWFITQSTKFINDYVLENVGEHVHLYRPRKRKNVQVYWWSYAQKSLTKTAFKEADDKQVWRINPQMLELYKSTANVTDGKARTSQMLVTSMITACGIFAFIGYMVYQGVGAFEIMSGKEKQALAESQKQQNQNTPQNAPKSSDSVLGVSVDTMPPQMTPNTLQAPHTPQMSDTMTQQPQHQTQNLPPNYQLQQKYLGDYSAEVGNDDTVRPAIAISFNGRCGAYNRFGEKLIIEQDHCKDMMKNGTMPKPRQSQHNDDWQWQEQQPVGVPISS